MSNKAFCSALQVQFQGNDVPVEVLVYIVVMNSSNGVVDGDTQITVPLVHSDTALSIQNKVTTAIKNSYNDQSLQVTFMNSVAGLLGL